MPTLLSVADFLKLVNDTLALIPQGNFEVEGEVVEFKISQGQWVTWTLKDEHSDAKLNCFTTTYNKRIPLLQDGMRIRATGYAKVNERFCKFSLTVDTVELVGEGAWQKAYEALKKKLEGEGLFDAARKRALPFMPERIGLITSREAAAYGDFLRVLGNRIGGLRIDHCHVHVQGKEAVADIVQAFTTLNTLSPEERPQVIVLTRGGGSIEELHAFNDEAVVRAVFSSGIPVMVGVGHERDETLCDFVADVRASTPSNAAERLVPTREELVHGIESLVWRVEERLARTMRTKETIVAHSSAMLDHALTKYQVRLERVVARIDDSMVRMHYSHQAQVDAATRVLASVNPQRVLARGYAIVRAHGKVVTSKTEVVPGEKLTITTKNGDFSVYTAESNSGQAQLI